MRHDETARNDIFSPACRGGLRRRRVEFRPHLTRPRLRRLRWRPWLLMRQNPPPSSRSIASPVITRSARLPVWQSIPSIFSVWPMTPRPGRRLRGNSARTRCRRPARRGPTKRRTPPLNAHHRKRARRSSRRRRQPRPRSGTSSQPHRIRQRDSRSPRPRDRRPLGAERRRQRARGLR